jgi:hypothetical protein
MGWLFGLVSVVAIFAAHRLGCWAEDRGWIYYRKKERPATHRRTGGPPKP